MGVNDCQKPATIMKVILILWIYLATRSKASIAQFSAPRTSTKIDHEDNTIYMAVLLPSWPLDLTDRHYPFLAQMAMPAIDMALEKFETILPNRNVSVIFADTRCSDFRSQIITVDIRLEVEADVYIGPCCEYAAAPTGRLLAHWNIPFITVGTMAQGFNSKEEYTTLTRLQSPYALLGEFIRDYFLYKNWNHTAFVFEDSGSNVRDCHFGAGAVFHTLKSSEFVLPEAYSFTEPESIHGDLSQEKIILEEVVKPKARGKFSKLAVFNTASTCLVTEYVNNYFCAAVQGRLLPDVYCQICKF